ncbi:MAG TPA: hypothetical protein VGH76_17540 [Actinomycetospora sp.]|uniref:hypothetical protein n=1 Tax=Actinomycetospora sp. TaxID=1872135 RepID=UPI002F3F508C
MTLSTLDPVPALVVVDLQRGVVPGRKTKHSVEAIFPRTGETPTTAEVLAALTTATAGV